MIPSIDFGLKSLEFDETLLRLRRCNRAAMAISLWMAFLCGVLFGLSTLPLYLSHFFPAHVGPCRSVYSQWEVEVHLVYPSGDDQARHLRGLGVTRGSRRRNVCTVCSCLKLILKTVYYYISMISIDIILQYHIISYHIMSES